MKLGSLFSGGKDSYLAMLKARKEHEISCLISIVSENPESYMFHTPNISLVDFHSMALKIPLIKSRTKGRKEEELKDLKKAIKYAKEKYDIKGIVTGAVCSTYQAERIQKICDDLDIYCFNPLWQMDQLKLLEEVLDNNMMVIIVGVFAEPFDDKWLGREINKKTIDDLKNLADKYKINSAGEGGEIETLVLSSDIAEKNIKIIDSEQQYKHYAGVLKIKKAELVRD